MSNINWKEIKGYEGLYLISDVGEVKSMKTGKIRTSYLNNQGYVMIDLWKNNKRKFFLIHRLVAIAFIPNPHNYLCVNHMDENKQNNNVSNLEWCTQKYNSNYGNSKRKIAISNSKPVKQLTLKGKTIKVFESALQAQREIGISNGCINECIRGKRKTAGGYIWQYVK